MAEERLQPLIQQAYGEGVQGFDTTKIQEIFGKDVEEKKQEYKTALDIGSDLSEKYYSQIGDDLKGIVGEASKGNLTVGSPQWLNKVQKFKNKALQAKQLQDQFEQRQELFLDKPDLASFYEEVDGEVVDTGYQGFLRAWEGALDKNYDEFPQMVNEHANIMQRMEVQPQGTVEAFKGLRKDAKEVSAGLLGGEMAARQVTYSYPASGNLQITTTTTLDDDATQSAIEALLDQYEQPLRTDWKRKRARGQVQVSENEYVRQTIEDMLVKSKVGQDSSRYTVPTKDDDNDSDLLSWVRSGSGWRNSEFVVDKISDNELKVNAVGRSEPNPAWVGYSKLGDGESGKKASMTSIVYDKGELKVKIVGEDLMEPVLVPFDDNKALLETTYGITKDIVLDMLGITPPTKNTEIAPTDAGSGVPPAINDVNDVETFREKYNY